MRVITKGTGWATSGNTIVNNPTITGNPYFIGNVSASGGYGFDGNDASFGGIRRAGGALLITSNSLNGDIFIGDRFNTVTYVQIINNQFTSWYPSSFGGVTAVGNSVGVDLQYTTRALKLTTTPRASLTTPVAGLINFNTTLSQFEGYNGTSWSSFSNPALSSIRAASASNTIDHLNFAQTWNWSTLAATDGLSIVRNTNLGVGISGFVFSAGSQGANSISNVVSYTAVIYNNNSGTNPRNRALRVRATNGSENFALEVDAGDIYFNAGSNIVINNVGAGTKIGTAANQPIGFWNATPIVQPTTAFAATAAFVANAGTAINTLSTFDGYTIPQLIRIFRTMGLLT